MSETARGRQLEIVGRTRLMGQSVAALAVAIALLVIGFEVSGAESSRLNVRGIKTPAELKEFLSHVKQSAPLVTAHRGGPRAGFPENAIATFENTLRHTWAMMEVDPRFTEGRRNRAVP